MQKVLSAALETEKWGNGDATGERDSELNVDEGKSSSCSDYVARTGRAARVPEIGRAVPWRQKKRGPYSEHDVGERRACWLLCQRCLGGDG